MTKEVDSFDVDEVERFALPEKYKLVLRGAAGMLTSMFIFVGIPLLGIFVQTLSTQYYMAALSGAVGLAGGLGYSIGRYVENKSAVEEDGET